MEDAIVEVNISPCPECGQNRWLMALPEDVARKKKAKRAELTAGQAFRRGAGIGLIATAGGVISRILFWRALMHSELPEPPATLAEDTVICANCGHTMSMASGQERSQHDWSIGG